MKKMWPAFFAWLPFAVVITGICLLVYTAVQQNYRQSLNDPQIQMAEDGAARLASGGVPADIVPHNSQVIDISRSLSPWIAVYDSAGMPLEANAVLDGAPPKPPIGVLDSARRGLPAISGHHLTSGIPTNENRVSWQHGSVRQAIVAVYVPQTQQYVVAGRSMHEVENREKKLSLMVGLAWAAMLVGTLFAVLFARLFN